MIDRQFGRRKFLTLAVGGTFVLGSGCRGSGTPLTGRDLDPSPSLASADRLNSTPHLADVPSTETPAPSAVPMKHLVANLPDQVRVECTRQPWYWDANPGPAQLALVRFLVEANENTLDGEYPSRAKPLTVTTSGHQTFETVEYQALPVGRQAAIVREALYQSADVPGLMQPVLVVASSHLDRGRPELDHLLSRASSLLPRISGFLGPVRYSAIHIQADLPGRTYLSAGANVFMLRDEAWGELSDFFLVHELAHSVHAPFDEVTDANTVSRNAYPWWYSEGIAELTADRLVPGHRSHAGYIPSADGGRVHIDAGRERVLGSDVDRTLEGGRGFELLSGVLGAVGEEKMASANRRVHESAHSGGEILAIYYRHANGAERKELEALFNRLVEYS